MFIYHYSYHYSYIDIKCPSSMIFYDLVTNCCVAIDEALWCMYFFNVKATTSNIFVVSERGPYPFCYIYLMRFVIDCTACWIPNWQNRYMTSCSNHMRMACQTISLMLWNSRNYTRLTYLVPNNFHRHCKQVETENHVKVYVKSKIASIA